MSKPITIGLTGLAGAGKDSVADVLCASAGFARMAFADRLRAEVSRAFQLGGHLHILATPGTKETPHPLLALRHCREPLFVDLVADIEDDWKGLALLDAPRSPRQILQWWGTEFRRAANPNYWSSQVAMRIADAHQNGIDRVVVTDCRFQNEASAIRLMGGEIWQVVRPGQASTEGNHASRQDGSALRPEAVLINGTDITGLGHTVLRTLQARHGGAVITIE